VTDSSTRERLKNTGIRELSPGDIAEAVHYAVSAPGHVNIATIELQPLEQTYGGVQLDPVDWEDKE
jgi:NADP-dependent 3-hydroxy acid dehydrogenase YdfG